MRKEYKVRTAHSLHHAHKKSATRTILTGEISIPDNISTLFGQVFLAAAYVHHAVIW